MKKERIFWGGFLILAAIALVLNKLGYFAHISILDIILSVFLLSISVKSLLKLNYPGILLPLSFIAIIYDKELGITAITPWTILFAALLLSIGLSMIFYKKPNWYYAKYGDNHYYNWKNKSICKFDKSEYETINIEDDSHIKFETSFGASIKYINTDKLEVADLRCHFGAMKVYFDNATLNNNKGLVRLDTSFGGVELYIPKGWAVENKTNSSFGGIKEKNSNKPDLENTLTLTGNISFSGVEIIYI